MGEEALNGAQGTNEGLGLDDFSYDSVEETDAGTVFKGVVLGGTTIGELTVKGRVAIPEYEANEKSPAQNVAIEVAESPKGQNPIEAILNETAPERTALEFSPQTVAAARNRLKVLTTGVAAAKTYTGNTLPDIKKFSATERAISAQVDITNHVPPELALYSSEALNLLDSRDFPPEVKVALAGNVKNAIGMALYLVAQESMRAGGHDAEQARVLMHRIVAAYSAVKDAGILTMKGLTISPAQRRTLFALYVTSKGAAVLDAWASNMLHDIASETAWVDATCATINPTYIKSQQYDNGPTDPMDMLKPRPARR